MVLLGDVAHVKSCFGPFGDSVRVGARLVHGLSQMYKGSESFGTHPLVLLGVDGQVEACFGLFGDCPNLDADRCTVCGERTIGSEIIFGWT